LDSRVALLLKLLDQLYDRVLPWHWLQYQLTYNGDGKAFRSLLLCLVLLGEADPLRLRKEFFESGQRRPPLLAWEKIETKYKFLWCFDEVQCDAASVVSSMDDDTILSCLVNSLCTMRGWHSCVLAGTALNLESVEKAVSTGITYSTFFDRDLEYEDWSEPQTRPLRCSRLVRLDKHFKDLLDPSIRSIVEVIWDATSPQLAEVDWNCIRSKLGACLVGNESIFEDSDFIGGLHQGFSVNNATLNRFFALHFVAVREIFSSTRIRIKVFMKYAAGFSRIKPGRTFYNRALLFEAATDGPFVTLKNFLESLSTTQTQTMSRILRT
jgi:hypothetical protein